VKGPGDYPRGQVSGGWSLGSWSRAVVGERANKENQPNQAKGCSCEDEQFVDFCGPQKSTNTRNKKRHHGAAENDETFHE